MGGPSPTPQYIPVEVIADRLGMRLTHPRFPRKWRARCSAHNGASDTSLSLTEGSDGKPLLHCHAGCSYADVLAAVDLLPADLFADRPGLGARIVTGPHRGKSPQTGGAQSKIVAEYDYRDEAGTIRYVVERREPKGFRQRQPDRASGWIWNLDGVQRILFRLPELVAADPAEDVYYPEGEKDVLRLASHGLTATTNAQGADTTPTAEMLEPLRGRSVIILPDNDPPGREHAEAVAAALAGIAGRVKIVSLAGLPPKGDVSDAIDAGLTPEELRRLADVAPTWSSPAGLSSSASCTAELPPFPIEVFPPELEAYIAEYVAAFGVPADMVAVPLLGFAGAAIGRTLAVELKPGWVEYPILWVDVIGNPGTGKSPALDHARRVLDRLQDAAWKRYEEDLHAWHRAEKEAKGRHLVAGDGGERPALESFFTTDTTTEAIAQMAQHAPGLAVIRDELVGWVKSHDAYRAGGDRQTHLSLWSGAPLKVDRKTAPPLYVRRPCVSVVGGIQPDRLTDLRAEAGQDDGFIDRLLSAWPDATPAKWSTAGVSPRTVVAAEELFTRLRYARGATEPPTIRPSAIARLDRQALAAFVGWHDDNADSVQAATGLAAGSAAKYPRQVARIAAILHALWEPDNPARAMDAETMHGAIAVIEYFRAHARRVLPVFGATGSSRAAGVVVRVARILDRKQDGEGWVSRTELHQRLGRSVPADQITAALDQLAAEGRTEAHVQGTKGRNREEWRARQPEADRAMKNEESQEGTLLDPSLAPFLHSSYGSVTTSKEHGWTEEDVEDAIAGHDQAALKLVDHRRAADADILPTLEAITGGGGGTPRGGTPESSSDDGDGWRCVDCGQPLPPDRTYRCVACTAAATRALTLTPA